MSDAVTFADVRGTIVTFTIIRVPTPEFAGEAPYGLAVIETADGERYLGRIPGVESDDIAIGDEVVSAGSDDHGAIYQVVR